jgi:ribokinase
MALSPTHVLATNELPHDSLLALFASAREVGARVIFNATPEPETVRELLEWVSVLIVNEVEAQVLLEVDDLRDTQGAVAQLLDLGLETVVLTGGKEGAWIGDRDGVDQYRPPVAEVVDTTGAGDTFCGAFVAELARGETIRDAVRYAVSASALSVTKPGAQSSIPTREEVTAILA